MIVLLASSTLEVQSCVDEPHKKILVENAGTCEPRYTNGDCEWGSNA